MAPKKQKLNFEESLEALEAIVEQMEDGDLNLEQSLHAFEKGVKLTRDCQEALKKAEQKVQLLISDDQGNDSFKDFDAPPGESNL